MGACESAKMRSDEIPGVKEDCCEGSAASAVGSIIQHGSNCQVKADANKSPPLWVDGIVPYEVDHSLDYNLDRIMQAMKIIESHSNIVFLERSNQDSCLKFTKANGCTFNKGSYIQSRVSLGIGSEDSTAVLHELLHAVGIPQEQKRPDRDEYIIIHWENIDWEKVKNGKDCPFWKVEAHEYRWRLLPFDYDSVMMYDDYAFSANGKQTIEARSGRVINRNKELSKIDRIKLSLL